jgi:hypothetical protein
MIFRLPQNKQTHSHSDSFQTQTQTQTDMNENSNELLTKWLEDRRRWDEIQITYQTQIEKLEQRLQENECYYNRKLETLLTNQTQLNSNKIELQNQIKFNDSSNKIRTQFIIFIISLCFTLLSFFCVSIYFTQNEEFEKLNEKYTNVKSELQTKKNQSQQLIKDINASMRKTSNI